MTRYASPACDPARNKRAKYFALKHRIALELEAGGLQDEADALRSCQEVERLAFCSNCASAWYVLDRCRQRICPLCSWTQSLVRFAFVQAMTRHMDHPKLVTLTTRPAVGEPRAAIKQLRSFWNTLRADPVFALVRGGCYQIELKPKEDAWHIHIHAVLDAPYIPYRKLFSAWSRIVGGYAAQVDVRAADNDKAKAYVCKYVVKSAGFEGNAHGAAEWVRATKGSRLFATFGEWYNVTADDLLDEDGATTRAPPCPHCGAIGTTAYADFGLFAVGPELWPHFRAHLARAGPPSRTRSFPVL